MFELGCQWSARQARGSDERDPWFGLPCAHQDEVGMSLVTPETAMEIIDARQPRRRTAAVVLLAALGLATHYDMWHLGETGVSSPYLRINAPTQSGAGADVTVEAYVSPGTDTVEGRRRALIVAFRLDDGGEDAERLGVAGLPPGTFSIGHRDRHVYHDLTPGTHTVRAYLLSRGKVIERAKAVFHVEQHDVETRAATE